MPIALANGINGDTEPWGNSDCEIDNRCLYDEGTTENTYNVNTTTTQSSSISSGFQDTLTAMRQNECDQITVMIRSYLKKDNF
jgi:hypothetical protein